MQPVLQPFRELVNPGYFTYLSGIVAQGKANLPVEVIEEAQKQITSIPERHSRKRWRAFA